MTTCKTCAVFEDCHTTRNSPECVKKLVVYNSLLVELENRLATQATIDIVDRALGFIK